MAFNEKNHNSISGENRRKKSHNSISGEKNHNSIFGEVSGEIASKSQNWLKLFSAFFQESSLDGGYPHRSSMDKNRL